MIPDWLGSAVGLLYLALGIHLILRGIVAARVSGFKFYLGTRLVEGLSCILVSFFFLALKYNDNFSTILLAFGGWTIVEAAIQHWERTQQEKVRASFPTQWATWESKTKHDHWFKRFFYPSITRQKQSDSSSDSDARSNKIFLALVGFMAIVGLIGLVFILLIVLGRRGF